MKIFIDDKSTQFCQITLRIKEDLFIKEKWFLFSASRLASIVVISYSVQQTVASYSEPRTAGVCSRLYALNASQCFVRLVLYLSYFCCTALQGCASCLHTHPFKGPLSGTIQVTGTRKIKPVSTPTYLQAECPSCRPTIIVKALKANKEKMQCSTIKAHRIWRDSSFTDKIRVTDQILTGNMSTEVHRKLHGCLKICILF